MKHFSLNFILVLMLVTLFVNTLLPAGASAKAAASKTDPGRLSPAAGLCVNKAQLLYQKGQIQEAITLLDKCIRQPENTSEKPHYYLYFLLGNYYALLEDKTAQKKAILSYQNALKIHPAFGEGWLNLARCFYETQQYKDAALAFEKGYEYCKPEKGVHLYYAAVCYFQSGNSEKALALFNTLLKVHPEDVTLAEKEILINILFSLEQYKTALPYIEELAHKIPYPENKKWQEILLHQYLHLEMDKKALAYAIELTRTDTLEPKWWKGLSHIHLKNDDRKKGLAALIIYGFLTPMSQDELELAADLYFSLDAPQSAADYYLAALKHNQTPQTLEKLAQAFAMAHDTDNAVKWIDTHLETRPVDEKDRQRQARLRKLRQQLVQMQAFFAKASPVLQP
ncbi:MAG: tetratricopeptide repeat protein [Proteobacteria bacterium]|nr:tetratricopeptide repeat protein [Pseudomonadota bacterium]MBU1386850.1 tetratricopeptide repeat protein [Pseudomonadota bacterium]MBU1541417.1 tetratricopeptide repeat protein [Pseudomonadota bacterium]MBU2431010.1 tetratricopeptide repeat protein [Pseudomonadota bacterium]MBU2483089.1 tetratricopeptide repeat protein [Pseudomonadota bacterium]